MASATRPSPARPLRRLLGLAAALLAAADLAAATAVEGNPLGLPTVTAAARTPMLAYGAVLLVVAVWAVATSFADEPEPAAKSTNAKAKAKAAPAPATTVTGDGDERAVIHSLRDHGWYVADDVLLPHVDVDHVAIGPAGVLAIQTMWTNRADGRGKAAARARIAAHQLRQAFARQELDVEVVPAVLAFGPGLTEEPGGVRVVDAVAVLNGHQAEAWLAQLTTRSLLPDTVVGAVRGVVADLREGVDSGAVERVLVH
jgi:hypothetical protein